MAGTRQKHHVVRLLYLNLIGTINCTLKIYILTDQAIIYISFMTVSLQETEAFRRYGTIVLRGRFTDWLDSLRLGIEKNMAAPGPFVRRYSSPGQGLFLEITVTGKGLKNIASFI